MRKIALVFFVYVGLVVLRLPLSYFCRRWIWRRYFNHVTVDFYASCNEMYV